LAGVSAALEHRPRSSEAPFLLQLAHSPAALKFQPQLALQNQPVEPADSAPHCCLRVLYPQLAEAEQPGLASPSHRLRLLPGPNYSPTPTS
jgi:hypothetical protein